MKNNSIKQVVNFLNHCPFVSENEICEEVWHYYRGLDWRPNKKYADLIRRGLKSGKIARIQVRVDGHQSRFFYYVPKQNLPICCS